MDSPIGIKVCGESEKISLKSLSWEGTVEGLLFSCTTTQEYINTDSKTLEISYTFPLSWEAAVIEFAAQINGQRLMATPLPKVEAEKKYEKALEAGDLPLLLQCSDPTLGLYTANLGNLKPGESVKIQIRTAQLLLWNNGEVRINLPTVIAERYSSNGCQGNLLPHEKVRSSLFANYKGTAKLIVKGPLAQAKVTCLNHVATFATQDDSTLINIANATPDRDIAFLFTEVEPVPTALRIVPKEHPGEAVEICTFYPLTERSEQPINLNILIDCSGSMCGIPIQQARKALQKLLENLSDNDTITFTRFGSSYIHDINRPLPLSGMNVRRDIASLLEKLDADLGGTEMAAALSSVLKISRESSDILLITDGEIWGAEEVIKEAAKGGHRIFVIGVSSSPAEPLLRQLASKTHGACTVVMPAENMKPVLVDMVEKMRTRQFSYELSRGADHQETNLWAGQSATFIWNESRPSALPELRCISLPQEKILNPNRWIPGSSYELYQAIIKIYALRLYRQADKEEEREAIAYKYHLLSPYVSFVMVHERSESEKSLDLPEAQLIPQMLREEPMELGAFFEFQGCVESPASEGNLYEVATGYAPEALTSPSILGSSVMEASVAVQSQENKCLKPTKAAQSKKRKSPLTAEYAERLTQKLKAIESFLNAQGCQKLEDLFEEKVRDLLSGKVVRKLSSSAQSALLILLIDVYWEKYAKKDNESNPLSVSSRKDLLLLIPFDEEYLRRYCRKILPMDALLEILLDA